MRAVKEFINENLCQEQDVSQENNVIQLSWSKTLKAKNAKDAEQSVKEQFQCISDTAVLEKKTLQYVKIDDNYLNVKKWSEGETEIERFSA